MDTTAADRSRREQDGPSEPAGATLRGRVGHETPQELREQAAGWADDLQRIVREMNASAAQSPPGSHEAERLSHATGWLGQIISSTQKIVDGEPIDLLELTELEQQIIDALRDAPAPISIWDLPGEGFEAIRRLYDADVVQMHGYGHWSLKRDPATGQRLLATGA